MDIRKYNSIPDYLKNSPGNISSLRGVSKIKDLSAAESLTEDVKGRVQKQIEQKYENSQTIETQMEKACKLSVNIPVHHKERDIERTLELYANQNVENMKDFEVVLFINSYKEEIDRKYFHSKVKKVQEKYPHLKVNLYFYQYQNKAPIGRIRKHLAMLTLNRAIDSGHEDPNNLILVSNDADLLGVSPNYIQDLIRKFNSDKEVNTICGSIDYPRENYFENHLLLATSRFSQYYSIISQVRHGQFTKKGGNTAFRAGPYAEAGGHSKDSRKRENVVTTAKIESLYPDSTKKVSHLKIKTNPRRAIIAMGDGVSFADQHKTFGQAGDLSEKYLQSQEKIKIPDKSVKVTNRNFKSLFQKQINKFYINRKNSIEMNVKGQADRNKKLADLEKEFIEAANWTGIKIVFKKGELKIKDISKFKEKVFEKYTYI